MDIADISKIVAGASGWIAAAITYWKNRADFKEKEANILRVVRRELDVMSRTIARLCDGNWRRTWNGY